MIILIRNWVKNLPLKYNYKILITKITKIERHLECCEQCQFKSVFLLLAKIKLFNNFHNLNKSEKSIHFTLKTIKIILS